MYGFIYLSHPFLIVSVHTLTASQISISGYNEDSQTVLSTYIIQCCDVFFDVRDIYWTICDLCICRFSRK